MMTVLVANRGEIARRIFRTAKRMGLRTVAVYSDADAEAPFVREADSAIRIGPAPARDSYLNVPSVIAAGRDSDAGLVHPGYGFLSEQAAFAEAVAAAGMTFVGPSPTVLRRLGDKAEAKAAAERAGVPVVPGYRGADQRDEVFAKAARSVEYPVLLKPAAGGGGIGMQLVTEEADLREALARARRTARAAFGDERLILERAIDRPRHVEIQLLADAHGTVRVLGERDCSAPRGHAIEARLYAEDPAAGFLPSTGRISHLEWQPDARVDSGIEEGSVVTADYDPLLAKVIVHAGDRPAAVEALGAALRGSTVLGVRTNERFLRNLLADPAMLAGRVDTGLIGRSPDLASAPGETPAEARALGAVAFAASTALTVDPREPWGALSGWRAGTPATISVLLDDRPARDTGSGPFLVDAFSITPNEKAGTWLFDCEPAIPVPDGTAVWVKWRGETYVLDTAGRERSVDALAGTEITAPMPGVVLAVHARPGQRVARGDLVCVVEAMKMELRVEAPGDGTVTRVLCAEGDQVKRGQRLAEFEAA